MSSVSDLQSTLFSALFGVLLLSDGLLERATGEPMEDWLVSVVLGGFLFLTVADDLYRRWRGDPRAREGESDARSLAVTIPGLLVLLPIGLWSRWQGHGLRTWGLLLAAGLLGVVLLLHEWYAPDA